MKRQPILVALTLLLVVGAGLWGVNYRLDHPPLTNADKEFRALVAGADEVRASQFSCQTGDCTENNLIHYAPLDAAETRELIESIRFISKSGQGEAMRSFSAQGFFNSLELKFLRDNKELAQFELMQAPTSNGIRFVNSNRVHYLNPRFNKRLNRALDAYLPQRIRP